MGWLFTFAFTCAPPVRQHYCLLPPSNVYVGRYSGFALLSIAVLWNANILQKLGDVAAKWRELRGRM